MSNNPDPSLVNGKKVYQFWFRRGNNKPEFVIFPHGGDLASAIARGKQYCERTGNRFCGVYPCLVDLDALEKMHQEVVV